jgi:Tol biopolymer transport system component
VILFSSLPRGSPQAIDASGFLSVVGSDGSNYRVLDDQHPVGGPPAPSPDGQTIAYGSGATTWLYHWETGPEVFDPEEYGLVGAGETEIANPAWSPDGTKLAWVLSGDLAESQEHRLGIGVFDLENGTVHLLHHYRPAAGDGWPPAPSWSPDGVWLAFEAWAAPHDQAGGWVARVESLGSVGGEAHHLAPSHPDGWAPAWSPDGHWLALSSTSEEAAGHWLTQVGSWNLLALDLPPTSRIVDWITWRP